MADDTTTIVAAAFENEDDARQALDALRQAGFGYDQVGVAPQGQNDIKLKDDLEALGVPSDVATYYDEQHKNGRTVVSVRPDGQDEQVHNLLHYYHGYDYEHQSSGSNASTTTTTANQPNNTANQGKYDVAGNYPPDPAITQSQSNVASTEAHVSSDDVAAVNTAASANYARDDYHQPRSLRPRIGTTNVSPDDTQTTAPTQSSDTVTE